ncbi:MAG: hypothetical protein PSV13_12100 [Lacunisphaera sp.]|nr:hypothetical protein [Lacunisphaera sp.]
MKRTRFPRLLLILAAAAVASLYGADEPAKEPAQPESKVANAEPIVLPTIQVTADRIREIDRTLVKLDKQITREKKKVKSTELDRALNNRKVATTAAIFGGNSADHLSAVAATRVSLMETERAVLEAMKRPVTETALQALETELEQLRITRRNLDDAAKQR